MLGSPAPSDAGQVPDALWQVLEILEDTHDDLSTCGPAVTSLISRTFTLLTSALDSPSVNPSSLQEASRLASSLLRLADEKLNSFPYKDVPLCWRRLYTDASLLGAIADLAQQEKREEKAKETVRKLDMVLIVAGAPGEAREELVFAVMEVAQERLRTAETAGSASSPRPAKKRRLSSPSPLPSPPLPPPYLHRPVPSLLSLPTFLSLPTSPSHAFDPSHPHSSPFVVRNAASPSTGWDAVPRWKDPSYLLDKVGPGRYVPVEVGADYSEADWGQRIMPFEEFLDSLSPSHSFHSATPPPIHYLAQHCLFRQFPSLLSDLAVPDLVFSAPSTDGAGKPYEGVKTPDGYIMNAWFGPGGTKSAAHTDPWWNCYVQVTGSKWVWVAPPSCSSSMAAFGASSSSSSSTPPSPSSPAASNGDDPATASETAEQYMTNTSSLDVTVPPPLPPSPPSPPPSHASNVASGHIAESKVPSARDHYYSQDWLKNVEPFARQVVLEAGDVLAIPPGWWHAMQSLETSFSVSIWF
ncbi:hypothetical protein JCM8547_006976 [Rhodosporidiobolus lusitaniae]